MNEQIVEYCKGICDKLNELYMNKNHVYRNELLNSLYARCILQMASNESYELKEHIVLAIFSGRKHNEKLLEQVRNGTRQIKSIDEDDNLILD